MNRTGQHASPSSLGLWCAWVQWQDHIVLSLWGYCCASGIEKFDWQSVTSNSYPITETENSTQFNKRAWVCNYCIWVFHDIHIYFQMRERQWHCGTWNRRFKPACFNINVTSISYKHARLLYSASPKKPQKYASVQHTTLYRQFCILQLLRHSAFNITQKINSLISKCVWHYWPRLNSPLN